MGGLWGNLRGLRGGLGALGGLWGGFKGVRGSLEGTWGAQRRLRGTGGPFGGVGSSWGGVPDSQVPTAGGEWVGGCLQGCGGGVLGVVGESPYFPPQDFIRCVIGCLLFLITSLIVLIGHRDGAGTAGGVRGTRGVWGVWGGGRSGGSRWGLGMQEGGLWGWGWGLGRVWGGLGVRGEVSLSPPISPPGFWAPGRAPAGLRRLHHPAHAAGPHRRCYWCVLGALGGGAEGVGCPGGGAAMAGDGLWGHWDGGGGLWGDWVIYGGTGRTGIRGGWLMGVTGMGGVCTVGATGSTGRELPPRGGAVGVPNAAPSPLCSPRIPGRRLNPPKTPQNSTPR